MSNFNKLIEIIKKAAVDAVQASKPVAFCFGKVISESPLQINVEQKITLGPAQLVLSRNVIDFQTKISFDNPEIKNIVRNYTMEDVEGNDYKLSFEEKVENEVTIYNHLVIGDEVILSQMQGGQKYIVLDRVGKL